MRTTVRLDDDLAHHVDAIRQGDDTSDAKAVREAIRRSQRVEQLEQRIDDLETELRHTEAELQEANQRLREAHSRIETTNELVAKVDSDLSARERKQRASIVQRAKWWLTGMDDGED